MVSVPPSTSEASTFCRMRSSGRIGAQVLLGEDVPHLLGRHLAALAVGDLLDRLGELDLQPARQRQAVIGLHDVGHAALAGLRVHPDDGLVGAADVLGVDRQIRHLPQDVVDVGVGLVGGHLHRVQALVDGVLVAAGERGVDQIAAVRDGVRAPAAGCSTRRCGGSRRCWRSRSAGRRRGRTGSAPASPGTRCRCARRCRTGSPRSGRRRPDSPIPLRRRRFRGRCAGAGSG